MQHMTGSLGSSLFSLIFCIIQGLPFTVNWPLVEVTVVLFCRAPVKNIAIPPLLLLKALLYHVCIGWLHRHIMFITVYLLIS